MQLKLDILLQKILYKYSLQLALLKIYDIFQPSVTDVRGRKSSQLNKFLNLSHQLTEE
jgi:hypothetical protein